MRLKRDDINKQILAEALAFKEMELMLNAVFKEKSRQSAICIHLHAHVLVLPKYQLGFDWAAWWILIHKIRV